MNFENIDDKFITRDEWTDKCEKNVLYNFYFIRMIGNKHIAKMVYNKSKNMGPHESVLTKYGIVARDDIHAGNLILPISSDSTPIGNLVECTIDCFLTPLISKVMKETTDYCIRNDLYNRFKCNYLNPILVAECSRMISENLNYIAEKPFIICTESAIARFLQNKDSLDNINRGVYKYLKHSLKSTKVIIYDKTLTNFKRLFADNKTFEYPILNYFNIDMNTFAIYTNKLEKGINIKTDTHRYMIPTDPAISDLSVIIKYYIKLAVLDYLTSNIIEDFKYNHDNEDVIERIKNEISISFTRNAEVFNNYLAGFNELRVSDNRIGLADLDFALSNRQKTIDDLCSDEGVTTVSESVISELFVKVYAAIGKIESLNRDYTTGEAKMAIDCERLRGLFEQLIIECKNFNVRRNILIDKFIHVTNKFKKTVDIDKAYYFASSIAAGVIENFSTSEKLIWYIESKMKWSLTKSENGKLYVSITNNTMKPFKISVKQFFSSPEFNDIFGDYSYNEIVSACKTSEFVEELTLAIIDYMNAILYLMDKYNDIYDDFEQLITSWKTVMRNNIVAQLEYDPVNEFVQYIHSGKSLCGIDFHEFNMNV